MFRDVIKDIFFDTDNEWCIKDRKGTGVGGVRLECDTIGGVHVFLRALRKGAVGKNGTAVSNFTLTVPVDPTVLREIGRVFMDIADKKEASENERSAY